jgi:hypothetical protein
VSFREDTPSRQLVNRGKALLVLEHHKGGVKFAEPGGVTVNVPPHALLPGLTLRLRGDSAGYVPLITPAVLQLAAITNHIRRAALCGGY